MTTYTLHCLCCGERVNCWRKEDGQNLTFHAIAGEPCRPCQKGLNSVVPTRPTKTPHLSKHEPGEEVPDVEDYIKNNPDKKDRGNRPRRSKRKKRAA